MNSPHPVAHMRTSSSALIEIEIGYWTTHVTAPPDWKAF